MYGDDRLFVSISVGAVSRETKDKLDALAEAGHPVIFRELEDIYDLGAEFFDWEFATALRRLAAGNKSVRSTKRSGSERCDEGTAGARSSGVVISMRMSRDRRSMRSMEQRSHSTICR